MFPVLIHLFLFYDSCNFGKLHLLPFNDCEIKAKQPLEFVYANLWGPAPHLATDEFRFYIIFVGAYARYTCYIL